MSDTSLNLHNLPGMLGHLARAGFGGAALRLAAEWGGTQRRIPYEPKEGCLLVKLIGLDAAKVLSESYPGFQDIPQAVGMKSLKQQILRQGGGTLATALALKTSERYVRRVRQDAGIKSPNTPDLFSRLGD